MTGPLEFHPAVRGEIEIAYRWYEERLVGLGGGFLDELQRVFAEIEMNTSRYGFALGDVREGILRRFPYAVYYRALPDRIRVLAVFHTSRDPAQWQART